MKATIERATLLKSLSHVQSVVERRNTIPILSNVLIEAREDGSIRLMATDLDLQVDESVPANVATPGATTVSAHTLFDIVRKLPEGSQVELNAAEGKMQLSAGRARFNLSTLPRDDFPVIAEGELPTRFELPAATLRQIIDKTRFAISTEEIAADYGSDTIEIGFNARYLLDILGEIDGDTVEVHLADAAAPTLLRENDKSQALYVLMPMRV